MQFDSKRAGMKEHSEGKQQKKTLNLSQLTSVPALL